MFVLRMDFILNDQLNNLDNEKGYTITVCPDYLN